MAAREPHPDHAVPPPRRTPVSAILIGLRGSGKSTIGRVVSESHGLPFVDLDDRTPALLDAPTAADAINTHGLAAFRDVERRALEAVLAEARDRPMVIALGGGTPTAPGASELLREGQSRGMIRVIYLHASSETLRDRLRATDTASRPSLTGADMLDEIETIYLQRDGLYRTLADRVIESAELDSASIAGEIVASLKA